MDLLMEPKLTQSLYNRAIEGFMRKERRVEFVFKQLFSNGIYSPHETYVFQSSLILCMCMKEIVFTAMMSSLL